LGKQKAVGKTEIGKAENRNRESRKLWVKQKLGKQKAVGKAESCG
jgi:hypothetical protein